MKPLDRSRSTRLTVVIALAAGLIVMPSSAQTPWRVTLTQPLNPLAAGFCGALQLTVVDPATGETPRNPQGARLTIGDFDITIAGGGVVPNRVDATHWESCACQGATAGSTATVTARYPAAALPANVRIPGATAQQSATFTVAAPKGTVNPPACLAAVSNSGAAASGVGVSGAAGAGAAGAADAKQATGGAPAAAAPAPGALGTSSAKTDAAGGAGAAAGPAAGAAPAAGTSVGQAVPMPIQAPAPLATNAPAAAAPVPVAAAAPVAVNPVGLTAVQIAPGQVRVSWQPVNGVTFYGLFGPGVTAGGERVVGATSFVATNVPPGPQEWAVGSFYGATNISTPASAFPRVTVNVVAPAAAAPPAVAPPAPAPASTPPAPSGRYLITVTSLRVYQASADDLLSRDGVGDEVYAAALVRRYDRRTSQLAEAISRQTMTYGDVFNFGGRLQGGSRSPTGGLQDGDLIPNGPLVAARSVPAQAATFPWRLWEGTLTQGVDALVITPSIWEKDGGFNGQDANAFYAQWLQNQQTINASIYTNPTVQAQIAGRLFGSVVTGVSGNSANQGVVQMLLANQEQMFITTFGLPIASLLQTSADRPLGLFASGRDQTALPTQTVVLTREIIEDALARPALGAIPSPVANAPQLGPLLGGVAPTARIGMAAPVPGILMVQFEDVNLSGALALPERPAIYQMFIQVERVP